MSQFELRKYVLPEIIMGSDVRLLAGNYFKSLKIKKVLVVTDKVIFNQPWFTEVMLSIKHSGIEHLVFDTITPNSPHNEVMDGADVFTTNKCEGILAIGGGSVMDSAKGIGVVYSNKAHILDFEGVDSITYPTPPIVCLPTTAGTSSDVSQFAIIRNLDKLVKIAIISKSLVPDVTLIDPMVSTTMDEFLTVCTGLDALTHAVEAFVSKGCSMVSDANALRAIELINDNILKVFKQPENLTYRYNMMMGSLEAGMAFSNASLGAVHAVSHSLGGLYNAAHGECNALLLDHVIRFNYQQEPDRYDTIARAMHLDLKGKNQKERRQTLENHISGLKKKLGLGYNLKKIGLKASDFSQLSKSSVKDPCLLTNPVLFKPPDIEAILKEAI